MTRPPWVAAHDPWPAHHPRIVILSASEESVPRLSRHQGNPRDRPDAMTPLGAVLPIAQFVRTRYNTGEQPGERVRAWPPRLAARSAPGMRCRSTGGAVPFDFARIVTQIDELTREVP